MEIIYKKLEDIKPYPNNPRFNDEAVEYVKVSEKSQWNFDLLEEELNDILNIDMSEFNFNELNVDDLDTEFELPEGDKGNLEQMTFMLANEQADLIRGALDLINAEDVQQTYGNTNKNGNAIYEVVKEWVEQKK